MLIDIDKIIVNDRIRRDYGDLEELAEDIKENTLLNPPVVAPNDDGTYTLIAGERRLRAMRDILGYRQVNVNTVAVRDDEHALLMEISENECRKEFTKTERLDYARRLARIEAAKAKERQGTRTDIGADLRESARTDETVADALGTSASQIRREQFIEDNRDLLDPADFAEWDEGKLSTNKAFQKIKAAQKKAEEDKAKAERERRLAEQEADRAKRNLADAYRDAENLEAENDALKRKLAERPKPEVIEREVVREVVPDDYEALKRRVNDLRHDSQVYLNNNKELRRQLDESRTELEKAKDIIGMDKGMRDVQRDVRYLADATNQYIRRYAGLTWTAQQFSKIDDASLEQLRTAVVNLATFSSALVDSLEDEYGRRHGA